MYTATQLSLARGDAVQFEEGSVMHCCMQVFESTYRPRIQEEFLTQVFYSVHEDTIEAAVVLHPCTVFFMSAAGFKRSGPPEVT
jgi:hypothetical protein